MTRLRVTLLAAVAPITWGTTYSVTTLFLPPDRPMTAALLRALPAALVLLALAPGRPTGRWWLRLAVLGVLNIGAFFPLLFVAAYRLPGGLAAVVGSLQPLIVSGVMFVLGWGRTPRTQLLWALTAVAGVTLTVLGADAHVDGLGIAAALAGTSVMGVGIVLTRRWGKPPDMSGLTATAWQLLIGCVLIAALVPLVDTGSFVVTSRMLVGCAWLSLVGTALAYSVWFLGARELPSTNLSLLGVLSPVTAALAGLALLGEVFTPLQTAGFVLALLGAIAGQRIDLTSLLRPRRALRGPELLSRR
ncbi:EamA family transporter [Micromonospora sp. 067-2]|uniref:EamA family transporter n=1 Tax=Micromonospora sp. 067-2 TaxID=2789270 RepID=UPI00397DF8A7